MNQALYAHINNKRKRKKKRNMGSVQPIFSKSPCPWKIAKILTKYINKRKPTNLY
jgi:hypothetical protein